MYMMDSAVTWRYYDECMLKALSVQRHWAEPPINVERIYQTTPKLGVELGVDRLSAWPIIGADIKHFTDYRYRPF